MQINRINISHSKTLIILRAWNDAILSKILPVFESTEVLHSLLSCLDNFFSIGFELDLDFEW